MNLLITEKLKKDKSEKRHRMDLNALLRLLEERLDQHDNSRKEIQSQLDGICSEELSLADSLEEKIARKIRDEFDKTEERVLGILNELSSTTTKESGELDALMKKARGELASEQRYEINHNNRAKSFSSSYSLIIKNEEGTTSDNDQDDDYDNEDKVKVVINSLEKQLNKTHESMIAAQDKVMEICAKRRRDVDELKKRINAELEHHFTQEDARLQRAVNLIRKNIDNENPEKVERAASKARGALVLNQKYVLSKSRNSCSFDDYDITATKDISLSYLIYNERKPSSLAASFTDSGEISLSFAFFSQEERVMLKSLNITVDIVIRIWEEGCEHATRKIEINYKVEDTSPVYFMTAIAPSTRYCLQMRLEHRGLFSGWSDSTAFTTPDFSMCTWKKCPPDIDYMRKYSVDKKNPRIASAVDKNGHCYFETIIGTVPLPSNEVASWETKILKSKDDDGECIYIGAAPFDINLDADNHHHYGWYFHCHDSTLHSGPPHNYCEKKYGPFRLFRRTVQMGTTIGATINTAIGALSFSVDGRNYGVAYEGIPLDKPLVPCVVLGWGEDSIELIVPDVKKTSNVVDSSIPVPSNIIAESTGWDLITLAWDKVECALFYQVEVDGSKFCSITTTNAFAKRGLFPETEHSFRVRAVRGNFVGEWGDVVKGKTLKESFKTSAWKECPDDVNWNRKYSVDEKNTRVAIKVNRDGYCTIIGNTPIPLNTVTSWSIKILKSNRNGYGIYIGVAPFDINQNIDNYMKCGWYFECCWSVLYSGSPYKYSGKKYGPRKENGRYVHTGDSVGVVVDTTRGDLSFVLDGVNHGVAYCGIPLDKPLVPCVILYCQGDSVELDV